MRLWTMLAVTFGLGCESKGDDSGDSGGSEPADCSEDNGEWPARVCPITADILVDGDLSDGSVLDNLDWADQSDVACWPGTENLNFTGAHLLYWIDQPEDTTLTAGVSPDVDVDVSIYVLQMGTTRFEVPPDVVSVVSCEAGYDQTNDSNPGESETAAVIATTNPYNVVIGVAGAGGATSGGFTLTVSLD